jgi:hypothetical protein
MAVTKLTPDGKFLKNVAGDAVYLRGVALGDLTWRTTFQGTVGNRLDGVYALCPNLTCVRVAISCYPDGVDKFNAPGDFDAAVDLVKTWCEANDVYFFTNFHGGNWSDAYMQALYAEFVTSADTSRLEAWHDHFVERCSTSRGPRSA